MEGHSANKESDDACVSASLRFVVREHRIKCDHCSSCKNSGRNQDYQATANDAYAICKGHKGPYIYGVHEKHKKGASVTNTVRTFIELFTNLTMNRPAISSTQLKEKAAE